MEVIYAYWWVWLLLTTAALVVSPRVSRLRAYCELVLAVAGILLILSLVMHMLPAA